jgi:hypothetical protein
MAISVAAPTRLEKIFIVALRYLHLLRLTYDGPDRDDVVDVVKFTHYGLTEMFGFNPSWARFAVEKILERLQLEYEQGTGHVAYLPSLALELAAGFRLTTPQWAADAVCESELCRLEHKKPPAKMKPPSRTDLGNAREDLRIFMEVWSRRYDSRSGKRCSLEKAFEEVKAAEEQAEHFIAYETVRNTYYRCRRRLREGRTSG